MKEFLMRELIFESEDKKLSVLRTRTSDGFASITISKQREDNGNYESISFSNDKSEDYEIKARELAKLIVRATENTCSLPNTSKGE